MNKFVLFLFSFLLFNCTGDPLFPVLDESEIPTANPHPLFTEKSSFDFNEITTLNQAISLIQTKEQAVEYLTWLNKRKNTKAIESGFCSPTQVIEKNCKLDCASTALLFSALLSDNGYPSIAILIGARSATDHMLFLYKLTDKFGTLCLNSTVEFIQPTFSDIDSLAQTISEKTKLPFSDTLPTYYDLIDISEHFPDYLETDQELEFLGAAYSHKL